MPKGKIKRMKLMIFFLIWLDQQSKVARGPPDSLWLRCGENDPK